MKCSSNPSKPPSKSPLQACRKYLKTTWTTLKFQKCDIFQKFSMSQKFNHFVEFSHFFDIDRRILIFVTERICEKNDVVKNVKSKILTTYFQPITIFYQGKLMCIWCSPQKILPFRCNSKTSTFAQLTRGFNCFLPANGTF